MRRLEPGVHRVFITVKTYPAPSKGHNETVCTAGVHESGQWVRLYPVDFRYLMSDKAYQKWQWITVELGEAGGGDQRIESHKVNVDSIVPGDMLGSKEDRLYRERRSIIDALPVHTYQELIANWKADQAANRLRTSLGIIRPSEIIDFVAEPTEREWTEEQRQKLEQQRFLGPNLPPLQKVPYKFSIKFRCEDSDKIQKNMIDDWEVGRLFLREVWNGKSEAEAIESVRQKYLDQVLDLSKRDVRLFMGTTGPRNSWIFIGVFSPPRTEDPGQQRLF